MIFTHIHIHDFLRENNLGDANWEKPNETRIHLSVQERGERLNKIRKKKKKQ